MQMKPFTILAGISLASSAVLGFAGSANAVNLATGSTFNFGGGIQLDSSDPTNFEVLFTTTGTDDPQTQGVAVVGQPVGAEGDMAALANGTLDFGPFISQFDTGTIESFDQTTSPVILTSWLEIGGFTFTLDRDTIDIKEAGVPNAFEFDALGTVSGNGFDSTPVRYDGFTAQGLGDDGVLGGDLTADDVITGLGSYSGTTVTVVNVPESSSIIGLLGLSGLIAVGVVKRRSSISV